MEVVMTHREHGVIADVENPATQPQIIGYIDELTNELIWVAKWANLPTLAYLLEITKLETGSLLKEIRRAGEIGQGIAPS
jgi:hypothetical protein